MLKLQREKAINQALSEIEAAALIPPESRNRRRQNKSWTALAELNHQEEGLLAQKEALWR